MPPRNSEKFERETCLQQAIRGGFRAHVQELLQIAALAVLHHDVHIALIFVHAQEWHRVATVLQPALKMIRV